MATYPSGMLKAIPAPTPKDIESLPKFESSKIDEIAQAINTNSLFIKIY
jgi:hypothetical protein